MALERAGLEQVDEEYWKLHIEEDIKPYGCLYPRCSRSLVLFAHRQEWESHMKSKHPSHWMQTVHTLTWFCDVDHNDTLAFETELQRREHVLDPALHPNREELPNEPQLAATTVRHKDHEVSEQFVCPLCECIPDEISRRIKDVWIRLEFTIFFCPMWHITSSHCLYLLCLHPTPTPRKSLLPSPLAVEI
jgi:hypothetical protein